jgi:hypothetical protein
VKKAVNFAILDVESPNIAVLSCAEK